MTKFPKQLTAETKAAWLNQSKVWLRAVDPHGTDGLPIYLLDVAEVRGLVKFRNAVAVMSGLLSLSLKPYLESTGRWAGPGFCCVVNVDKKANLQNLDCCVLHEFSHWLDSAAGFSRPILEAIADCNNTPAATAEDPVTIGFETLDEAAPWLNHSPRFIRAVCHLSYRAGRESNDVWWGSNYRLSPASDYKIHLGDELKRLVNEPLIEILRTPFPDAFLKFAAEDLGHAERRYQFRKSLRPAKPAAVAVVSSSRNQVKGITMNPLTLVKKIVGKQHQRRDERVATFRELVADIVTGNEPSPTVVEDALDAAGKTTADLEKAVALGIRRIEMQTELKSLELVPAKLANIAASIRAVKEEYQAAHKRYADKVGPLQIEQQRLENAQSQTTWLKRRLRETAPPELVEQQGALDRRARPLVQRLDAMKDGYRNIRGPAQRECAKQMEPFESELADINVQHSQLSADAVSA